MNRRTFLKILSAGVVSAASGQLAFTALSEPYKYEIVEQRILLRRLGAGLHGLRAVQISDLHMNTWFTRAELETVIRLSLQQKPDLIFITGDFLTNGGNRQKAFDELYEPLRDLAGRMPVFSVLGNHDFYNRADRPMLRLLREVGINDVTNGMETYQRNGDTLHIAGIGTYITRDFHLNQVDELVPPDSAAILLAHEPDVAKYTQRLNKFGLQISGHTHGGQINLPLIGPLALPEMGTRYPAGLYAQGDLQVYTNRGVGMTHLPLRLNCPPEITVFIFESR